MKEFWAVIVAIAVGITIRFMYDFIVKPMLLKKPPLEKQPSFLSASGKNKDKTLKKLLKATENSAALGVFITALEASSKPHHQEYASLLKPYNKKDLHQDEQMQLEELLKNLKKTL